jgi:hypothetical protein
MFRRLSTGICTAFPHRPRCNSVNSNWRCFNAAGLLSFCNLAVLLCFGETPVWRPRRWRGPKLRLAKPRLPRIGLLPGGLAARWRPAACGSAERGTHLVSSRRMFADGPALEKPLYRAQTDEAPSMYEMEGASSGLAAPGRLVAQPSRRCAPPAGARYPRPAPVSRLLPRSGVSSGWCPFPTVEYFYRLGRGSRKSLPAFISGFFSVHTMSTDRHELSTGLCTALPQVLCRNSVTQFGNRN